MEFRYSKFCTTKYSPSLDRTVKRRKFGMVTINVTTAQKQNITIERFLLFRVLLILHWFLHCIKTILADCWQKEKGHRDAKVWCDVNI